MRKVDLALAIAIVAVVFVGNTLANEIGGEPNDWDAHFVLINDIDLSGYTGTEFNLIGYYFSNPFIGVFEGNGHSISNFTYTATEVGYVGLFAYVGYEAIIKNLTLINPNVDGAICERPVGALVSYLEHGTIYNCNIEGGNIFGNNNTGGLVGSQYYGLVSGCHATCNILSSTLAGGLVGRVRYGTILNCYATGDVESTIDDRGMAGGLVAYTLRATILDCYATGTVKGKGTVSGDTGGLIGFDYQYTVISNCYASGAVTGENRIGGLLGRGRHSTISNCYARGSVSGNNAIGGLVGFTDGCTISNSYSVGTVSGGTQTGAFIGNSHYYDGSFNSTFIKCFWDSTVNLSLDGIGNTTDPNVIDESTPEMQQENTFTDAGWDFVDETANGNDDIWIICDGVGYPVFWWQCYEPPIEVEVEIDPQTFNVHSNGKWISCRIWLPEDYDVADVNTNSILLEEQIAPAQVWINEEEQVVMTKFSRAEVQDTIEAGEVELIVSGELFDGAKFEGTDTMRVIDKGSRGKCSCDK